MSTPATKTRSDSKLASLSEAQQNSLIQGMLAGWSYMQAIDWLWVECGLKVRLASMTPFYRKHVEPIRQERKKFAALSASTLAKMAKETAAFDAAAIGELKEYAYRLIRDPNSDPESARKWMETRIKAQAQQTDTRKLMLLEAKAAQADAAKDVLETKLTPEEQNRRLREILK